MFGEKLNIWEMANLSHSFFGEGNIDNVKTEMGRGLAEAIEIITAGTLQFAALAAIHGLDALYACACFAGTYFDEHQHFVIAANKIDLIVPAAPIAGNDAVIQLLAAKFCRQVFSKTAFFRSCSVGPRRTQLGREKTADFLKQLHRKCLRREAFRLMFEVNK